MAKNTDDKNTADASNRRKFLGNLGGAAAAAIAASSVVGAQSSASQDDDDDLVKEPCATALTALGKEGGAVRVIGRVTNGKVTFDQAHLEEFARTYPNAEMAFVAVNAPFDPVRNTCIP